MSDFTPAQVAMLDQADAELGTALDEVIAAATYATAVAQQAAYDVTTAARAFTTDALDSGNPCQSTRRPDVEWPEGIYELEAGRGLAVCVCHKGAHGWYLDGCHALPTQRAPYTNPLARCREDPTCRLADGTHVHAPPTRIEIDVNGLAEAIVRASRAVREERQPRQSGPPSPDAPPPGSSILDRYGE